MIEHLNNINIYTEDNYLIAEVDVNNVLKDADSLTLFISQLKNMMKN